LDYKNILHRLVDCQQFTELKANAQRYLDETADKQALPLLALAYAHLGERAEAVEATQQAAAQIDALDLDARVDLAAVYCLMQRLDDAVELLEAALVSEPEHPLALARLAWCRMTEDKLSEARGLYEQAATQSPERLPVWSALTRLCLEDGDYTAAQEALDTAIFQLGELHTDLPELAVEQFTAQFRSLQLALWIATDKLAQAEQWLEERRESLSETDWVGLVGGYATLLAGQNNHAAADEALREALKHYSSNLALISQLAELAQMQGRTQQVIHLLRRAIALSKEQDKSDVGLWVRLSSACLHTMETQARTAAEKAVALADELDISDDTPELMIRQYRLQAKNALAQVESQAQNFATAETLFNEVLADNPYFLPALQGLGQQQMQCGKIDDAIALFERVKDIDPTKGYSSLINARQFPDDEITLTRMEKVARQRSMEGSVRASLLLQLATAWEKRKDYDKAFSLASEANESSKQLLHYDPQAHRNSCARTRYAFSNTLYEHRKDCGYRGEDESMPVYVLGMPRSGTTLVEQILAGHSQIFGAGELGVIPQRIQGLNRWERHTGSGRTYPDCIDDLGAYVTEGIAKGVLDELRELAATDKPDAQFVVDKLPHNFENIGFIKFLFPKAKIISVRRDPRDIALSNYFTDYQAKHGGMGFAYDLSQIGEQLADHNQLLHHWDQVFPGEILEMRYEDVVEDLEGSARKMLDYIGVDWEPEVLAFNELDRPVKTASVWQVRQPIYKTSTAKWMRYQDHLAPLIQGTNKKLEWDAIEMITLPEPGWLNEGVGLYKEDKLDEAEYCFKKILHHLPEHAAANFMLGIIYARKNHLPEAIELMEKAHKKSPWNPEWRKDLIQAYEMNGEPEKAEELKQNKRTNTEKVTASDDESWSAALTSMSSEAELN
jgi:tetratricopeptide (TPR) repeat protein